MNDAKERGNPAGLGRHWLTWETSGTWLPATPPPPGMETRMDMTALEKFTHAHHGLMWWAWLDANLDRAQHVADRLVLAFPGKGRDAPGTAVDTLMLIPETRGRTWVGACRGLSDWPGVPLTFLNGESAWDRDTLRVTERMWRTLGNK